MRNLILTGALLLPVLWPSIPARAQDNAAAIHRLKEQVQLDPASPARRTLGMLHLGAQRFLPAYANLRQWVQQHPSDHEARRSAAYAAVQLNRLAEAEELLKPLAPNKPRTSLLWGDIHLRKGEADAAIEALEPLRDQDQVPALLVRKLLAESYLLARRYGLVIDLLSSGDEGPSRPEMALLLATAQFKSGDTRAAVEALWPHRESELADVHHNLGRYLVMAGRFEDAVPILERAVEADPENRVSWESLARACFATDRREEAQSAVAAARKLATNQTKESKRQVAYHRELRDPSGVHRSRAVALGDQGKWEEALAILNEEIQIFPDDSQLRDLAAVALLRLDRVEDALVHSRRASQLNPDDPSVQTLQGVVLQRLGRLDEARAAFVRALDVDPGNLQASRRLAELDRLATAGDREP